MFAEALTAEMDALPVAFAEFALERVGVGAFERDARLPERFLGGANLR